MREIGACFVKRGDAIEHRHRRAAQSAQLREDKPHPMGTLSASLQLGQDRGEDRLLGGYEAREIERIVSGHNRFSADAGPRPSLPADLVSAISIQVGAWSLAFSQPRTALSTSARIRRPVTAGLNSR